MSCSICACFWLSACGRTGLNPYDVTDFENQGSSGGQPSATAGNGVVGGSSTSTGGVATGGNVARGGSSLSDAGEPASGGSSGRGNEGEGGAGSPGASGAGGDGVEPCSPVECPPPWVQVGAPLPPGYIFAIASAPSVTGTVFVGSYEGGGVFKTTDSAATWTSVSAGLEDGGMYALAVDPFDASRVWAGTRVGLFFSSNGGARFERVDLGSGDIIDPWVIAPDPVIRGRVYVALSSELQVNPVRGALYVSQDGGVSWTQLAASFRRPSALHIDRSDPNHILLGTYDSGVLESRDAGKTFHTFVGAPNQTYQIAYEPSGKILCAVTSSGVARSTDGGQTWSQTPAKGLNITLAPGPLFYVAGYWGVYRSTDCADWTRVDTHNGYTAVVDAAGAVYVAVAEPGTGFQGVRRSPDGVSPFVNVNSGLTNAEVRGIALDPQQSGALYVTASYQGIYHSSDAAATFESATGDIGHEGTSAFPDKLVFDGKDLFAFPANSAGRIFHSANGGTHWSSTLLSLPNNKYAIATDLLPSSVAGVVYVGTSTQQNPTTGLEQSTDTGASFSPFGTAAFNTQRLVWDKLHAGWMWAIGSAAGAPYGSEDEALYLSQDTGQTFAQLPVPVKGRYSAVDVALTPEGEALYLSVDGHGVLRSDDAGQSFILKGTPPGSVTQAFVVDPSDANTLYLASGPDFRVTALGERGLYKSRDGGQTWSHADGGIVPGVVRSLVIEPAQPQVVYATMVYGGLYKTTTGGE